METAAVFCGSFFADKIENVYKSHWQTNSFIVKWRYRIARNQKKLKEVLSFGESTYSNVVFAKQRKLKESISNIVEDDTLSKEITDVLRMALLELDGVSIDEIERNINSELDGLYKRWDIEKNYPEYIQNN